MSVAALRRAAYADQVATGPNYLGHDTFTRVDGALGTAEVGGAWTVRNGTWSIAGNQARETSGSSEYGIATLDVGASAVDMRATVDPNALDTNDMGLVARVIDPDNLILFDLTFQSANWLCKVFQRVAGVFLGLTALVDPVTQLAGDPDTPFRTRLVVGGSYGIDGGEGFLAFPGALDTWVSIGSWSVSDDRFRAVTSHGLAAKATSGSRWDNVEILAAP